MKREKIILLQILLVIVIGCFILLILCPKTDSMTNGIMQVLSAVVGVASTILVQKIHQGATPIEQIKQDILQ